MKAQKRNSKKKRPDTKPRAFSPKSEETIIAQSKALAEPLCEAENLELVHVEYQREAGGRILRLYIDKPGGVTLDDCVNVSRQMDDLLDVHLEDIGPYSLEVTSPGSDRPLSKLQDFERFSGEMAKIKTIQTVYGQKNFRGIILGISGEQVNLLAGEKTIIIPFQDISKARLVDYHGEI